MTRHHGQNGRKLFSNGSLSIRQINYLFPNIVCRPTISYMKPLSKWRVVRWFQLLLERRDAAKTKREKEQQLNMCQILGITELTLPDFIEKSIWK